MICEGIDKIERSRVGLENDQKEKRVERRGTGGLER